MRKSITSRTRRFESLLAAREGIWARKISTNPPIVEIKNATFYRHQPSISPTEDELRQNRPLFPDLNFALPSDNVKNEFWAIIGPGNAGKTTFFEIIRGQHLCFPPTARSYPYLSSAEIRAKDPRLSYAGHAIQYVGFNSKERGLSGLGTYLSARYESRREASDYSVLDYLRGNTQLNGLEEKSDSDDSAQFEKVIEDLRLRELVDMPVSNLSNGQTRRARIAKALLGQPEVLLLDEPFMGLDPPTTIRLSPLLRRLATSQSPRLLLSLRPQDPIPDWITHVMYFGEDLKITHKGLVNDVCQQLHDEMMAMNNDFEGYEGKNIPRYNQEFGRRLTDHGIIPPFNKLRGKIKERYEKALMEYKAGQTKSSVLGALGVGEPGRSLNMRRTLVGSWRENQPQLGEPVIEMNGVKIKYGEKAVLGCWEDPSAETAEKREGLWWTVQAGQRWGIFGPNGSGKTTLLSLIMSDHPQAYSAPMRIFGRSRLPSVGQPGISLFDIQSRIGHSSPEVHAFFPRNLTVRRALESAWSETPLGPPKLSFEADRRVDACLRWFQGEINPALGMNPELKANMLRRSPYPKMRDVVLTNKNAAVYQSEASEYRYEQEMKITDSVDWADELLFGEIPFSAQRVVLFLRAIIASPDIVVLDEAFSGMDDVVRDKCLVFLEHGQAKRQSLYSDYRSTRESHLAVKDRAKHEQEFDMVFTTGLTDKQALLVVSHVREEVPFCVRDWIYLPEVSEKKACRIGRATDMPITFDSGLWSQIWSARKIRGAADQRAAFYFSRE